MRVELVAVEEQLAVVGQRRSYAQAFSWPVVHLVSDSIELFLTVARKVCALWQILAHQPVGVLVGAVLPRSVRITEADRQSGATAQHLVHRNLPALVVRRALAHERCDAQQLFREGLHHVGCTGRLELGQLDEHEQPAGALPQRTHRAGVGRPINGVALPVSRKLPIFDLRRANMDADHVGDLTSSVLPFAAGYALVVRVTQGSDQLALELEVANQIKQNATAMELAQGASEYAALVGRVQVYVLA